MEYRFTENEDREEILDHIDLIFSKAVRPHDFATLIPAVYGKEHFPECSVHALAEENGRIRGCVAVRHFDLTAAGRTLKCGYVGSVSVHPSARGQGVMSRLIDMQEERARADGLALLVLGGRRQRYVNFGFHPCSVRCIYTITKQNVSHALAEVPYETFSFEEIQDGSPDEQRAYELYSSAPVTFGRTSECFAVTCRGFFHHAEVIRKNGCFAGYLVTNPAGDELEEIVPMDPGDLRGVIRAWLLKRALSHMTVTVQPWNTGACWVLSAFAEQVSVSNDEMMCWLDPRAVLEAFLALRCETAGPADGELTVGLKESGLRLVLTVKNGGASVTETDREPSLWLSEDEAIRYFFTPEPMPWLPAAPAGWLPLPFLIPEADRF